MAIKDVLPEIRKEKGITQEELAAKVGSRGETQLLSPQ